MPTLLPPEAVSRHGDDPLTVPPPPGFAPWPPYSDFHYVKLIATAPRNMGRVEEWTSADFARVRKVASAHFAVRRLPRVWTRDSSESFERSRPGEPENPWVDHQMSLSLRASDDVALRRCVLDRHGVYYSAGDDSLCFVLEYARGGDVHGLCSSLALPPRSSCAPSRTRQEEAPAQGEENAKNRSALTRTFLETCLPFVLALGRKGIAHCDISLENIVLRDPPGSCPASRAHASDADGIFAFVDFSAVRERVPFTSKGEMPGKTPYLPPEVLDGTALDAHPFDLFSLGVCGFVMLTGTFPVDAGDPLWGRTSDAESPTSRALAVAKTRDRWVGLTLENLLSREPGARGTAAPRMLLEEEEGERRSALPSRSNTRRAGGSIRKSSAVGSVFHGGGA
jgi:serine/threonine protein kinase